MIVDLSACIMIIGRAQRTVLHTESRVQYYYTEKKSSGVYHSSFYVIFWFLFYKLNDRICAQTGIIFQIPKWVFLFWSFEGNLGALVAPTVHLGTVELCQNSSGSISLFRHGGWKFGRLACATVPVWHAQLIARNIIPVCAQILSFTCKIFTKK